MPERHHSFPLCLLIASGAAVIGSFAAALCYVVADMVTSTLGLASDGHPMVSTIIATPIFALFVAAVALIVTLPISLIIGAPLLWLIQRAVLRWPFAGTTALALTGFLLAVPVHYWLNARTIDPDRELGTSMLFGAFVAGAHGVVTVQATWHRWRRTLAVGMAAAIAGTLIARIGWDAYGNRRAARQVASSCSDALFVMAPAQLAAARGGGHRLTFEQGRWASDDRQPAVLTRYSALFVDGVRTLVANDRALAVITPWSRLGIRRAVREQCLSTLVGSDAAFAREVGLVRSFRWEEADPAASRIGWRW